MFFFYDAKKGARKMSIARITMMEYLSEKEMAASEDFYQTIQKEWFGNAQTVINVRTGPTSLLSLAVYSSYEDAETNLPKRKQFHKKRSSLIRNFNGARKAWKHWYRR